jgi:creatinine amidohydrolase
LPLSEAGDGKSKRFKLEGLKNKVAWTPRNWQKATEDTGVGNPKKATPEKGKKCTEYLINTISDFLVELAEADLNDLYQ